MESVKVFLTTAQKNKMQGGKPFQLSATQLQAGSGKHHVEIQMTAKNHKALENLSALTGLTRTVLRLGRLCVDKPLQRKLLQICQF